MPVTHVALVKGGNLELIDVDAPKMIAHNSPEVLSEFIRSVGGVCENVFFSTSFEKPHKYGLGDFVDYKSIFEEAKKLANT